jgi:hypothetical protein
LVELHLYDEIGADFGKQAQVVWLTTTSRKRKDWFMNALFDHVARIIQAMIGLALGIFTGLLVMGVFLIAMAAVLLAVMWSLLTGRKPAVFSTFSRFRRASHQFRPARGSGRSRPAGAGQDRADVVDVQAYEVK